MHPLLLHPVHVVSPNNLAQDTGPLLKVAFEDHKSLDDALSEEVVGPRTKRVFKAGTIGIDGFYEPSRLFRLHLGEDVVPGKLDVWLDTGYMIIVDLSAIRLVIVRVIE